MPITDAHKSLYSHKWPAGVYLSLPETPLSRFINSHRGKTEVIYDKALLNMAAGEDRITDERLGAGTAGEGRCIFLCRPIAAIRRLKSTDQEPMRGGVD